MAQRTKKLQKDKPTKQEYDVAKFLRFNVPTKKASLHGMEVNCFFASAAVDALLDSQWSTATASEPLFVDRNSCVDFCHRLIEKGLFHRASQVKAKKKKGDGNRSKKKAVREAAEKEDGGTGDEVRERKRKADQKEKREEAKPEKTVADEDEVKEEQKTEEKKEEKKVRQDEGKKKKKEKPLKLLMTDDQRFLDGEENIYVWIYDPPNAKTLVIGSLIVFGSIAMCLFPLWPEEVHVVVYNCSLVGIVFVGSILGLAIIRFIVFCLVWLLTLGRHHLWLLPNLTEDVGFFQSFRPLYQHDRVVRASATKEEGGARSGSGSRGQAQRKARSSDREDTDSEQEFEMVGRLDLEGDAEQRGEGEESEENGEEEEECGVEDEEYDEEDEDCANEGLQEEEEDGEEETEKDGELKKDK